MDYWEYDDYVKKIKDLHYRLANLLESALEHANHLTSGNVAHHKVGITESITWAPDLIQKEKQ